jgi:hypothetical protein
MSIQNYNLVEHSRRFAIWCASIAASRSPKCRFSVEQGKKMITETEELYQLAGRPDLLPEKKNFDTRHKEWRLDLINNAQNMIGNGAGREFTHGVAAKLINVYLKSIFLSSNIQLESDKDRSKIDALHPPIDRLLLTALGKDQNCPKPRHNGKTVSWNFFVNSGWSKFNNEEYEEVIKAIHGITQGVLWKIESYWKGHQD